MIKNTILAALKRMGNSKDEIAGHGFNSSVKAAYNHAQHLPGRRKMMQSWADYLDTLKNDVHTMG